MFPLIIYRTEDHMRIIEQFEKHNTLNPKLWNIETNTLLPEVRQALINTAQEFISNIEISTKILDARIVGSQASFNYTKYSDLDLHLVCDFKEQECSFEILQSLYNALKGKFNQDYSVQIRDIDVEIYVEDLRSSATSNGIYSVYQDRWIRFPEKLDNVPQVDIQDELEEWIKNATTLLFSGSSNQITEYIDNLYLLRKDALQDSGEFSVGNLVFKEIRNLGILDKLKERYKSLKSRELTVEHLTLHEDSRSTLLSRSKRSEKGFQRFKRRVKSRVANSVKQYNSIDMNKLFKQDILTVDINVRGETDDYIVKISFGGFQDLVRDELKRNNNVLNLKTITRALINGFNKDDVYINCSCADWQYRYAYHATKNQINSGQAETRPSDITNPDDNLGTGCKHVLLVLSNTSWILKVAATVYNYINYMQKHYEKLYANVIYPAIYGKDYEEPVQLDIFDDDELNSSTADIDTSNMYARTKNQFKAGNKEGVRFAPKSSEDQQSIEDIE